MPRADTQAMNAHLAESSSTVAEGAHAVLVRDGAGWHGSGALVAPDTITLPPYGRTFNLAENFWAFLRANRLAISVFETCAEIVTGCCDARSSFDKDTHTIRSITNIDQATTGKVLGCWHKPRGFGPAAARTGAASGRLLRPAMARAGRRHLSLSQPSGPLH